MILQCPSCAARFLVADALIPEMGRTVKCGKCAHQWFVAKDDSAPIPMDVEPAGPAGADTPAPDFAALTAQAYAEAAPQHHEPKQLPVIPRKPFSAKPFMIAAAVLAVAWLGIAVFAYFPGGQHSAFKNFYNAMGASDTRDLVFSDVSMEREMDGARTRFLISGSIANHGANPRTVPMVRVQVKDDEGKIIWQQKYAVNETVQPGQLYPFRIDNVETSFASRAKSIVLDMGNSFELVMR